MSSSAPARAPLTLAPAPEPPSLAAALVEARAEVEHLTHHDAVTGCLCRRGLARALAERPGGLVLAVDCDDFARLNDTLGYTTADLVLRELADRLRTVLGPAPLARIAGDRFVALVHDLDLAEGRAVAERIRLAVAAQPFAWEPAPVRLTVSVGVGTVGPATLSVDELLALAQVVVKRGKRAGKNVVATTGDLSASTSWQVSELRAFMSAVRTGEGLTIHAQSIHALPSEAVEGWELLVRGPAGALESPVDLFRTADEQHLATPLDLTCLRLALRAARRGRLRGLVHLNLLPTTLLAAPMASLLALLAEPPADGRWCVELSERQFLGDPTELVHAVAALRAAGVLVAIDDVGSCRGTLDSLLVLDPDIAKLDIRLVRGIATDPRRQHVVARLSRMADALGAELVAEGVEDRADLAMLVGLGIRGGQGWLWSRATPVERLVAAG
jgi:diguanylate cyclase (GGDEF)-like protein